MKENSNSLKSHYLEVTNFNLLDHSNVHLDLFLIYIDPHWAIHQDNLNINKNVYVTLGELDHMIFAVLLLYLLIRMEIGPYQ